MRPRNSADLSRETNPLEIGIAPEAGQLPLRIAPAIALDLPNHCCTAYFTLKKFFDFPVSNGLQDLRGMILSKSYQLTHLIKEPTVKPQLNALIYVLVQRRALHIQHYNLECECRRRREVVGEGDSCAPVYLECPHSSECLGWIKAGRRV